MVDGVHFSLDLEGFEKMLQKLELAVRVPVSRSGALAGAKVIRDEARQRAPVYKPKPGQRINKKAKPGTLRDAIYVAYSDTKSSNLLQNYNVSWNAKKAPHGHLVEFGHWLVTSKKNGSKQVRRIPGQSFLRSAYEAQLEAAMQACIEAMRRRYAEIMEGGE